MVLFRVRLNRPWFEIHNKILNFYDWTLCYNELFHNIRKKWRSMDLSMDMWQLRIIVFELFDHWTMLIVFLFLVLIISKFYPWISEKHDRTSNFVVGSYKISLVHLSTCLYLLLSVTFLSGSTVDFFQLFVWGYFAIYTKNWQSDNLENCVCCLDNWANEANLDPKQNTWHFNDGNITFCALSDAP